MTDEQLANELREAQAKVAECFNELNSRGWRIVCFRKPNAVDDYDYDRYGDENYKPWKPYVFKITKDKVVIPDQEI